MSIAAEKTQAIVDRGLAAGADDVVATTVFGEYRQIRFSDNQIDIGTAWNDYTTDVMLSWQRRVVTTQLKDLRDLDATIDRLYRLVKVSRPNPHYGGVAQGRYTYRETTADQAVRRLEDPSAYITEALDAATQAAGRPINAGGILTSKYERVYLASSGGPTGRDERSAIELSIRAFAQRDASGHGVECASTLQDFHPTRAGEKAGAIAKLAVDPKAGRPGTYDVILDPLVTGSLLGVYGYMGSAYNAMINLSAFTEKLGETVGTEAVTIRDAPRPYSVNHRGFDAEGVPVRETPFIEDGVLTSFFHNTSTAAHFRTATTGHAGIVVPMPWNLEMAPGDATRDELIRDLDRGLYLTNTWYTRFQSYATGDFSTIPRDGMFLIENGDVTESWRGLRLSDNVLNILRSIEAVSRERHHVHWWLEVDPPSLAPYLLARSLRMTQPR
jgi:PmbA protein